MQKNVLDYTTLVNVPIMASLIVVIYMHWLYQVCAASQGCMNNLTLGEANWGYYETVAGGSGAVSSTIIVLL